jgi:hypothetical protein
VFVISRRVTQRTIAAGALALALPVLAGCGIDSKDETQKEHSQVQAADDQIGDIQIRDAFLTTPLGPNGIAGNRTYLVVTLVNNGSTPDTFTGVTTALGTATLSSPSVTLPPGVVVQISDPQINPTAPTLVVSGTTPIVGNVEPMQFSFATAGTTPDIDVPVVNPGGNLQPTQVVPTIQATFATPIV